MLERSINVSHHHFASLEGIVEARGVHKCTRVRASARIWFERIQYDSFL